MDSTRMNKNIFTAGPHPLFTGKNTADIIKHQAFSFLQEATPVWTPAPQKRIHLTAVQASAPLGVTISLSSGDGQNLLSLRITNSFATTSRSFSSPCRLKSGDAVFIRTSDEETACEAFGAANATQIAYNSRSDFSNAGNAAGLPDGQYATLNSGLLIATRGRIVLGYSMNLAAINQLQIESVVIKFYCRLSLTLAVGTSTMIFYWRPNSADNWIELQQASLSLIGTLDYLTTPLQADITADVLAAADPWEVIQNLQTSFVGTHTGLGLGNVIQLDAVEIEICVTGMNHITLFGYET